MKHPVAALHGTFKRVLVEDIALVQGHTGIGQQVLDELPAARAEVIHDRHLDAVSPQASTTCEPINPAPPVTHALFMTIYKLKPAATASR